MVTTSIYVGMRVQAQLRAQRLASGKKAKDKAKNAMRKATTSAI